ncbi:toll/interleukin-1 receptor domain-containing protein [Pseudarthrobacter sp. MDT3-26]|uniref:toll/interleukin-1 receptor domain-containing protein n=1 Tax=Pseudarthrobacter raffinosi TaxID=2953651 RepID=UPI00208F8EEE|nr:toll/interleukin-1 receptor domain-containing protein [Pseudarthrobacter sp. MDT3-26]MCO4262506.1 toll/interleukin-1 receptor domain-containing protein [Pseudarthrobacter sp. MDT3-26]
MKVFISWSKNTCEFAGVLNEVVGRLFDTVTTFYSPEIPAGEQWLAQIEEELTDTDFGIICVSKENQMEQWLNYEAGALSRQVGDRRKRLGVLLLNFDDTNQVVGPFKNFQMKMADIEGFRSLMKSLNEYGPKIRQETLDGRIDNEWISLAAALEGLKSRAKSAVKPPERTVSEKIDELLAVVRDFDRALTVPVINPPPTTAGDRYKGQSFTTKVYGVLRGRPANFAFRALNELTDVLDSSTPLSELEKKAIQHYYRDQFGDNGKNLVIIDPAWKDQYITSPGGPLSQDLPMAEVGHQA